MAAVDLGTLAHRVLLLMNRKDVTYALAGGLAVGVHGHVRATEDIDLVVPDQMQADRAMSALREDGWLVQPDAIRFPDGGILNRAVLIDASGHWVVDVIIAPPGSDLLSDRERSDLDGCVCWIISLPSLVRMKRSSGRPRDLDDIARLGAGP